MELALGIVVLLVTVGSVVVALAVFVWAAVEDGRKDRATQARLGIKRRTRLGR